MIQNKVYIRISDGFTRKDLTHLGKCFIKNGIFIPRGFIEKPEDYREGIGIQLGNTLVGLDSITTKNLLITDLIRTKYSLDLELALINNYNLDSKEYSLEYNEYQLFRLLCKQTAKSYFDDAK